MRKYYTRPCNFYYGNYANKLIKNKKALSLAGNPSIAFDKVEIFQRKKKHRVNSNYYSINEITEMFGQTEVEYIPARPGEYDVTLCDYSKASEILNYNPVKNIDEYIKGVIG